MVIAKSTGWLITTFEPKSSCFWCFISNCSLLMCRFFYVRPRTPCTLDLPGVYIVLGLSLVRKRWAITDLSERDIKITLANFQLSRIGGLARGTKHHLLTVAPWNLRWPISRHRQKDWNCRPIGLYITGLHYGYFWRWSDSLVITCTCVRRRLRRWLRSKNSKGQALPYGKVYSLQNREGTLNARFKLSFNWPQILRQFFTSHESVSIRDDRISLIFS